MALQSSKDLAEQVLATHLLLSEAIRKGIEVSPVQKKGLFFGLGRDDKQWATCALGAAYCGIIKNAQYTDDENYILAVIQQTVGVDWDERMECPAEFADYRRALMDKSINKWTLRDFNFPCHNKSTLLEWIFWLNDEGDWTREQIADWLQANGK